MLTAHCRRRLVMNTHDITQQFCVSAFKKITEDILKLPRFALETPNCRNILQTANYLLSWITVPTNSFSFSKFIYWLSNNLLDCLAAEQGKKFNYTVWSKFHQLKTSQGFVDGWKQFLEEAVLNPQTQSTSECTIVTPLFYQYVTDSLFDELIKHLERSHHQVTTTSPPAACTPHGLSCCKTPECTIVRLTRIEENALRYVCGFICRKLGETFSAVDEPLKGELSHAVMELAGDEVGEESTEEWTNKIDRGDLWHVNDDTYDLFADMEHESKMALHRMQDDLHESGSINMKEMLTAALL